MHYAFPFPSMVLSLAIFFFTASPAFAFLTINVGGKKIKPFAEQSESSNVPSKDPMQVGTRVQCNWKGQGRLYPGSVTRVQGNSIHIKYDDGDQEDTVTSRCKVIAGNVPSGQPQTTALSDALPSERAVSAGGSGTERDSGLTAIQPPPAPPLVQSVAMPVNELLSSIDYTSGAKPTKDQLIRLIQECVRARLTKPKTSREQPEICTIRFSAANAFKPDVATTAEFDVIEGDAYMEASLSSQASKFYQKALTYYYEVKIPNDRLTEVVRSKLKAAGLAEPTRNRDQLVQIAGGISDASLRECAQSMGAIPPTHSAETINEAFASMDLVAQAWSPDCRRFVLGKRQGMDVLEELSDFHKAPRCERLVSQVPWEKAAEREFTKRFRKHCEDNTKTWTYPLRESLRNSLSKNQYTRAEKGDPDDALKVGALRLQAGYFEEALKMFTIAVQGGNSLAPVGVAAVHVVTNGRGKGGKQALPWIKKSAEAGNPNGMWMLGWAYDYSVGTPRNEGLARKWYDRALEAGYLGNRLEMNSNEYILLAPLFRATPETQTTKRQAMEEGMSNAERLRAESEQRKTDQRQQRCQSACSQGEFVQTCIDCKRSFDATW